jgi:hypothetical protein
VARRDDQRFATRKFVDGTGVLRYMARRLATKALQVLLARVSDFVPDGLRTHPDVVDDA